MTRGQGGGAATECQLAERVVIVTGAGRGLGREHAVLLGSLGAKVVVNDVGGAVDGRGKDASAADAVVAEIRALGGEAVASSESITDWRSARALVALAVETFGDLHGVVNNAGILRDRMLVSMTEEDFDAVVAVHLKGTFNTTRWAADYWRGRSRSSGVDAAIVNTSSGAGLHGNVGQTSYVAAKAGIAAMTVSTAMELKRYGVRVNCVAPLARTRLTAGSPATAELMNGLLFDAAHVSPLVAYLVAPTCPFTGQVFSVYGGGIGIYRGWSIHQEVASDGSWSLEHVERAMESLPRRVPTNDQAAIVMAAQSR